MKICSMIEELLETTELSHQAIVDRVKSEFPEAKTTTKSVASIASVARKYGVNIAKRKPTNSTELVATLKSRIEELETELRMYRDEKVA